MEPKDHLIFALDVANREEALRLVKLLRHDVGLFKVGWELFMAEGPRLLSDLAANLSPAQFFLDLKLYDIPNTLRGAMRHVVQGVTLLTIHCDLGPGALRALVSDLGNAYKILAVTLLTSVSGEDLAQLGYAREFAAAPEKLVVLRAGVAQAAGCHGVICSGREAGAVKAACGEDFLAVCPGIRPAWSVVAGDDQRRVVTPFEAMKNGADYIVVGRPIRTADKPVAAARKVVEEIAAGLAARRASSQ
jgi:orotidine-5'-phosphate decarboxylase